MQMVIRKASVRWGTGARGARVATTESGALTGAQFSSANLRRRNSDTNSAELIAAAHAGSFALSLAAELGKKASGAGEILVSAAVTIEHLAAGWTITNIHLNVVARLPHLTQGEFIDATVRAKTTCLVSKALRPTVSMYAKLEKPLPRTAGRSERTDKPAPLRPSARGRTTPR